MSGHHGHGTHHDHDTFGKWMSVATALLGLCVAVNTIVGHKAHTASLTDKAEATDKWGYFQAKKIRAHEASIAATQYEILGTGNEKAAAEAEKLHAHQEQYEQDAAQIKLEAEIFEARAHTQHTKGAWLDLSEGLFELGVILCSLYFLSKKKLFPAIGFTSAAAAALIFGWAFIGPTLMPANHGGADHPTSPETTAGGHDTGRSH